MTSLFYRSFLAVILIAGLGTLASCSDSTGPAEKKPLLSGPPQIDFGATSIGNCKDTTIRYDNTTAKAVTLSTITIDGSAFTWIGAPVPIEVAAGASVDLKLRFCPVNEDTSKATLVLKGSGGEDVTLTLKGFANNRALTVGSTFTFSTFLTDGKGARLNGTDDIEIHTITAVNRTFAGKSGVTSSSNGQAEDHFALESNGNVSTFLPSDAPVVGSIIGGWRELPFGTKAQNVVLLQKDTSITFNGFPVPVQIKQVASYTGQTALQVMGETYAAENVTLVTTVTSLLGGLTVTIKLGYVPAIGYLGTYNSTTVSSVPGMALDDGISKTLTTFQIK